MRFRRSRPWPPRQLSMARWRLTVRGWTLKAMAVAGNPPPWWQIRTGGPTWIAGAGSIRTAAGIGFRIIPGVGLRSIMAAGSGTAVWAGAGHRTPSGGRPGFPGAIRMITVVGRPCRRERAIGQAPAFSAMDARSGLVLI